MAAENLLDTAASLTFTTLLALVPLVTIALTVFSAFPAFASFTAHIKQFLLSNLVPEAATRLITVYGRQFVDNAARLTAFAPVSLLFFLAVMVILGVLGGQGLHPVNYGFLSAAFFAFHLLLAYLVEDCCRGKPEICRPLIASALAECC